MSENFDKMSDLSSETAVWRRRAETARSLLEADLHGPWSNIVDLANDFRSAWSTRNRHDTGTVAFSQSAEDGTWWIDHDGDLNGPYESEDEAYRVYELFVHDTFDPDVEDATTKIVQRMALQRDAVEQTRRLRQENRRLHEEIDRAWKELGEKVEIQDDPDCRSLDQVIRISLEYENEKFRDLIRQVPKCCNEKCRSYNILASIPCRECKYEKVIEQLTAQITDMRAVLAP